MVIVTLTKVECEIAEIIGHIRRQISLERQRTTRRNFTDDGLNNDIESSAAELAVAKYLNIYPEWSPTAAAVPKFDLSWRGIKLDVKSTKRITGNLLIDDLDRTVTYILACGTRPNFTLKGYLEGERVPKLGIWRTDMPCLPCWFVSADKLNPLQKLSRSNAKRVS